MRSALTSCLVALIGVISTCHGQSLFQHPVDGSFFAEESLPTVSIECGDALEWIYQEENWYSNIEHPATFTFSTDATTETVTEVGFRLRGNTSRAAGKKSFKVSFNTFDPDGSWQGLKKINLNGEHNDPSTLRARLIWECFRDAGIPVSRSTHVNLYINGDYHGIYSSTEHIDGKWIDKRFPYGHGNLWKCTYPADLNFMGPDPDDYKFTPGWSDQRVYELKTNENQDNYEALAVFIDRLNNASDEALPCALEEVFDVEAYLKVMAGEILAGHWDNYVGNKNNFYLYQRSFDGRLMYLPYDVDNTLGIQWFGEWTDQNPYEWTDSTNRPLYSRILENEHYRDRFSWYLNWWMENWFTAEWALNRGEWIQGQLEDGIAIDPFYALDYGFDTEAFGAAITESWGSHVAHGIAPYVEARNFWADVQLEPIYGTPHSTPIAWAKGPVLHDTLQINAWGHEVEAPAMWSMTAVIQLPDGSIIETPLEAQTSALHGTLWTAEIPLNGAPYAHWQVISESPNGELLESPCSLRKIWNSAANSSLIINELMPKNSSNYADAAGDFQDWAEVYNAGSAPINIASYFLSNRWSEPDRWPMPNVTLEPGQHMLLWCDDEMDEGPLHTSFTLNGSEDELYIFQKEDEAWRLTDSISWTNAPENNSFGRAIDGDSNWIWFEHQSANPPTPNASNGMPANSTQISANGAAEAWQNFQSQHSIVSELTLTCPYVCDWNLITIDGRICHSGHGASVACNSLPAGFFIFQYTDEENNLSGSHRFLHLNH